jgi:hypothetical protein
LLVKHEVSVVDFQNVVAVFFAVITEIIPCFGDALKSKHAALFQLKLVVERMCSLLTWARVIDSSNLFRDFTIDTLAGKGRLGAFASLPEPL